MENNFNFLSTRGGFNTSMKHFKIVNSLINEVLKGYNLADLINESLNTNIIKKIQIKSIINILLVEKFQYCAKSFNLLSIYDGALEELSEIFEKWNLFDIVIVYYHPQLGTMIINPKNKEDLKAISDKLNENELMVIYTGFFGKEYDKVKAYNACDAIAKMIQGGKIRDYDIFKTDSFGFPRYEPKKPEKEKQVPDQPKNIAVPKKLSGKLGIVVTNEVFHNGNVEAWKKIIESYETKFPDTKILVFYDNEQIKDINSLFKWGKVKSGSLIYISLFGPEFRFLSQLKRYLYQGASHNFEIFIKGRPGNVLNLF